MLPPLLFNFPLPSMHDCIRKLLRTKKFGCSKKYCIPTVVLYLRLSQSFYYSSIFIPICIYFLYLLHILWTQMHKIDVNIWENRIVLMYFSLRRLDYVLGILEKTFNVQIHISLLSSPCAINIDLVRVYSVNKWNNVCAQTHMRLTQSTI